MFYLYFYSFNNIILLNNLPLGINFTYILFVYYKNRAVYTPLKSLTSCQELNSILILLRTNQHGKF